MAEKKEKGKAPAEPEESQDGTDSRTSTTSPLHVSADEYATAQFGSHAERWFCYAVHTLAVALPLGGTEKEDLRTKSDLYFLGALFRCEATVVAALAAMGVVPTDVLLYNSKRGSLLECLNHVFGYRNNKEHGKDTSGLPGLVLYLEKTLEFLRLFSVGSVGESVLTTIKTAEREILLALNYLQRFARDVQSGRSITTNLALPDVSVMLCKRVLNEVVRVLSPMIAACRLTKWDFDHLDSFKKECLCSRTLWYHHLKGKGEERASLEARLGANHGAQWEGELRAKYPKQGPKAIMDKLNLKIQHEVAAALFGDCAECRAVMASCHDLKNVCSHMQECEDCRCEQAALFKQLKEARGLLSHGASSLPLTWAERQNGSGVDSFLKQGFDELDVVGSANEAVSAVTRCSNRMHRLPTNVSGDVLAFLTERLLPMSFNVTTRALQASCRAVCPTARAMQAIEDLEAHVSKEAAFMVSPCDKCNAALVAWDDKKLLRQLTGAVSLQQKKGTPMPPLYPQVEKVLRESGCTAAGGSSSSDELSDHTFPASRPPPPYLDCCHCNSIVSLIGRPSVGEYVYSRDAFKLNKELLVGLLGNPAAPPSLLDAIRACEVPHLPVQVVVDAAHKEVSFGVAVPRVDVPLIGRDSELSEIVDHLSVPGAHRVGLTGPPGIGKSYLALQVAKSFQKQEARARRFDIVYILNGLDSEVFKRDFEGLAKVLVTAGKIRLPVESEKMPEEGAGSSQQSSVQQQQSDADPSSERAKCAALATQWLATDPLSEKVLLVVDDLSPDVQLFKFIAPASSTSLLVTAKSNVLFAQHGISTEKVLGSLSVNACLHICESLGVDQEVLALQSFQSFLEQSLSCHALSVCLAALEFLRPRGSSQPVADFAHEKYKLWVAATSAKTASAFKPDYPAGLAGSIQVAVARLSEPTRLALEAMVLLIPANEERLSNGFEIETLHWKNLVDAARAECMSRVDEESTWTLNDPVVELIGRGLASPIKAVSSWWERRGERLQFHGLVTLILQDDLLPTTVKSFDTWKRLLSTRSMGNDVVNSIERYFCAHASSFPADERAALFLLVASTLSLKLSGYCPDEERHKWNLIVREWMTEYEDRGPSEVLAVLHEVCVYADDKSVYPRRAVDIRIALNGGDPKSPAVVGALFTLAKSPGKYRDEERLIDEALALLNSIDHNTEAVAAAYERMAKACGEQYGMEAQAVEAWRKVVGILVALGGGDENTEAVAAAYERMAEACGRQSGMKPQAGEAWRKAVAIRVALVGGDENTEAVAAAYERMAEAFGQQRGMEAQAVEALRKVVAIRVALGGGGENTEAVAAAYERMAELCGWQGGMEAYAAEVWRKAVAIRVALSGGQENTEAVAAAYEVMAEACGRQWRMKAQAADAWRKAVAIRVALGGGDENTEAAAAVYERMAEICGRQSSMMAQAAEAWKEAVAIRVALGGGDKNTEAVAATYERMVEVCGRQWRMKAQAVEAEGKAGVIRATLASGGENTEALAAAYERMAEVYGDQEGMEAEAVEAWRKAVAIRVALGGGNENTEAVAAAYERVAEMCGRQKGMNAQAVEAWRKAVAVRVALGGGDKNTEAVAAAYERMAGACGRQEGMKAQAVEALRKAVAIRVALGGGDENTEAVAAAYERMAEACGRQDGMEIQAVEAWRKAVAIRVALGRGDENTEAVAAAYERMAEACGRQSSMMAQAVEAWKEAVAIRVTLGGGDQNTEAVAKAYERMAEACGRQSGMKAQAVEARRKAVAIRVAIGGGDENTEAVAEAYEWMAEACGRQRGLEAQAVEAWRKAVAIRVTLGGGDENTEAVAEAYERMAEECGHLDGMEAQAAEAWRKAVAIRVALGGGGENTEAVAEAYERMAEECGWQWRLEAQAAEASGKAVVIRAILASGGENTEAVAAAYEWMAKVCGRQGMEAQVAEARGKAGIIRATLASGGDNTEAVAAAFERMAEACGCLDGMEVQAAESWRNAVAIRVALGGGDENTVAVAKTYERMAKLCGQLDGMEAQAVEAWEKALAIRVALGGGDENTEAVAAAYEEMAKLCGRLDGMEAQAVEAWKKALAIRVALGGGDENTEAVAAVYERMAKTCGWQRGMEAQAAEAWGKAVAIRVAVGGGDENTEVGAAAYEEMAEECGRQSSMRAQAVEAWRKAVAIRVALGGGDENTEAVAVAYESMATVCGEQEGMEAHAVEAWEKAVAIRVALGGGDENTKAVAAAYERMANACGWLNGMQVQAAEAWRKAVAIHVTLGGGGENTEAVAAAYERMANACGWLSGMEVQAAEARRKARAIRETLRPPSK